MTNILFPTPAPVLLPLRDGSGFFPVTRIFCVGRNYADHAKEMGHEHREPGIGHTPRELGDMGRDAGKLVHDHDAANIAVELPEAPYLGTLYRTLFLGALVLFMLTFFLNGVAEILRQRLREKNKLV